MLLRGPSGGQCRESLWPPASLSLFSSLRHLEGFELLLHRKKKVREFPVPSRDVTTKLSLGGNNDVITELSLPRGSLVSDIPAGDGKLVNLFLRCGLFLTFCRGRIVPWPLSVPEVLVKIHQIAGQFVVGVQGGVFTSFFPGPIMTTRVSRTLISLATMSRTFFRSASMVVK